MTDYQQDLESQLVNFTLSLYNNPVIPRNVVQHVIDGIINFIVNSYTPLLQKEIEFKLEKYGEPSYNDLDAIFSKSRGIFKNLSTEYLRLKTKK